VEGINPQAGILLAIEHNGSVLTFWGTWWDSQIWSHVFWTKPINTYL